MGGGEAVLPGTGLRIPAGACDCHVHVFGPVARFPFSSDRTYTPGPAPTEDLVRHQRGLGLSRTIVVQPSVYGTDNRCTLAALAELGDAARGVAVCRTDMSAEELWALHEAGIRGLRLNLVAAEVGDPRLARAAVEQTAAQARPLGWHVQIFATPQIVLALREVIADLPVPVVIDHFGGIRDIRQPEFPALLALVERGSAYVKLSAAYLVSDYARSPDVAQVARTLMAANAARLLWGSNWPHPAGGTGGTVEGIAPFRRVDDAEAISILSGWAGAPEMFRRILVENPAALYGFETAS